MVFAPAGETPNSYNLWKGFGVVATPGDSDLFLDHMRRNICGGDEEHFSYLLGWMARAVQRPDSPGEVAIVLRGGRGTGKSFFAREFGKLFGRHFLQIGNAAHLTGKFNAHLQDVVVLFADEAFVPGDKNQGSVLKTLITEPLLAIERKGVDVVQSPNFIHLIMASNDDHVVAAGVDERRFFVLDVADTNKQDLEYFGRIAAQMEAGGHEALLHLLQAHDMSSFEVRRVPQTAALLNQKELSLEFGDEFILALLETGLVDAERPAAASYPLGTFLSNGSAQRPHGLYEIMREREPRLRGHSDKSLGGILKRWNAKSFKSNSQRGWSLLPLGEMRAKWEQRYGPRDWADDEQFWADDSPLRGKKPPF